MGLGIVRLFVLVAEMLLPNVTLNWAKSGQAPHVTVLPRESDVCAGNNL
jgi:hypothetical protein